MWLSSVGSDHGGAGAEISGPKPHCVLYYGGRGRREATDGPGWGFQTNVRYTYCYLHPHSAPAEANWFKLQFHDKNVEQ